MFLCILWLVVVGIGVSIQKPPPSVSPIPIPPEDGQVSGDSMAGTEPMEFPTPIRPSSSLREVVNQALSGTHGTYAIVIKNIKTNESYVQNEHMVFPSGSLYKLWIMAVVYRQIQEALLSQDQILRQDVETLNAEFHIDPEYAELTEGTVTFTIHEALHQMITISHNYAAMLLTEKVKLSSVAKFLTDNGYGESSVGTQGELPTTTAADIALFFENLYMGKMANEEHTSEMISLLKEQQLNNGIPKYLPDPSKVANKTGEIDFYKHDGGIIFTDTGDYILVVLSKSDSPIGAQERIASLSKAVYEYFSE